jgi:hypothetical protein
MQWKRKKKELLEQQEGKSKKIYEKLNNYLKEKHLN